MYGNFKTKFALRKHEITHGNKIAKPYSCEICKKKLLVQVVIRRAY